MTITVECPKCKQTYRLKDELSGRVVRCKKCQNKVTVPSRNDEIWDEDFSEYESRPETQKSQRKKTNRSKRKSSARKSSSFKTPPGIMVCICCIGINILMLLLLALQPSVLREEGLAAASRLILPIVLAATVSGIVSGKKSARKTALVLYSLALGLGLLGLATWSSLQSLPPNVNLGLTVNGARTAFSVAFISGLTVLVSINLKPSRDWLSKE